MSRLTHGLTKSRTYKSWNNMMMRCFWPGHIGWEHYGGRGITVCERWKTFSNFHADMGIRPDGQSLDRIDREKDYCPENCRWATGEQQMRNTSYNRILSLHGITMCATEWELALGFRSGTIFKRAKRGWDTLKILSTPVRPKRRSATC